MPVYKRKSYSLLNKDRRNSANKENRNSNFLLENDSTNLDQIDKLPSNDDNAEKRFLCLERFQQSDSDKKKPSSPANRGKCTKAQKKLEVEKYADDAKCTKDEKSTEVEKQTEDEKFPVLNSAISNLTEKERNEHFDLCLKLCSENKVTVKNAFGLHLIDFFVDTVKKHEGEPNFQMASLTLHASAQIYSYRVDCLHMEAVKMAASLHRGRAAETDKDPASSENVGTPRSKMKRKKKGQKKFLTPGSEKSLDGVLETVEEPHENFHLIKSIFDGGQCGGLLYELPVLNDSLQIPLAEAYPYLQEKQPYVHSEIFNTIDGPIKDMLDVIINSDLPVVPALELFDFATSKWPLTGDSDSILESPLQSNAAVNELFQEFELKCVLGSPDLDNANEEAFAKIFGNMCNINEPVKTPCFEDLVFSPAPDIGGHSSLEKRSSRSSSKKRKSKFSFANACPMDAGSVIKSFRTSAMEPPTPYHHGTVAQIIGPLFKHTVDPVIDAAMTGRKLKKNVPVRKKKSKAEVLVMLDDMTDKARLKILRSKRKCRCSKYVIKKKWISSHYVLPKTSFNKRNFSTLQLISDEPSALGKKNRESDCFEKLPAMEDFENECDTSLPQCSGEGIYGDEEELCVTGIEAVSAANATLVHMGDVILDQNDLVPKPEMVKPDIVHYAKSAKTVNQKYLKTAIWSKIAKHYGIEQENEDDPGSKFSKGKVEKGPDEKLKLSVLYVELQKTLPPQLKEKVTVALVFVALLHLANEKNLNVENEGGNLNDAIITIASPPGEK